MPRCYNAGVWRSWLLAAWAACAPAGLLTRQNEPARQSSAEVAARLKVGADLLQRGEVDSAIRELKAAIALDPQFASGHMLLGQAYLAQHSVSMIAEAKAELQQALDLDPTLLWARFYLAKVYIDLGQNDRAKKELERGLAMRPNVPHFLALLGEVNRKLGHPEISLELNRKALEADPQMTPAHYHMALAYMDLNNEDQAISALEKSVQSPYVAPDMYLTLGSLYTRQKRYREAEDMGEKAIALDPSRPEGHVRLAQLYNVQGASDRALAELKLALPEGKSYPTTAYYQQLHADVFFEQGRAYQAKRLARPAIQAYLQALAYDPGRGEAHRQLAGLLFGQGDYARARQHAFAAEKLGASLEPALRQQIQQGASAPAVP